MRINYRMLAAAAAAVAIGWITPAAHAQCVTGGAGTPVPAAGTGGGGAWPTLFPVLPGTSTLSVTVPSGATVLKSVVVRGLTHTWAGDVQIVLENPAGGLYNVFCNMPVDDSSDFGGDYEFVDPIQGQGCAPTAPPFPWASDPLTPGTYVQEFGGWPDGSTGGGAVPVYNTPIEQIPISSGTWTLRFYDWVSGDFGACTSWELCFGSPTPPPPPIPPPNYTCVTGGGGGLFPAGGVDGTWPTVLPTGQLRAPLTVAVPSGATKIKAVELLGFGHSWAGDVHVVLESPSGAKYNVLQCNDNLDPYFEFGDVLNTGSTIDLAVVDATNGQDPCGGAAQDLVLAGQYLDDFTCKQRYGIWNSGDAGISNTDLESIPLASGTWYLEIYDWYVLADDGILASWSLCFDSPSGSVNYCTAGTSTNGCVPTISSTGTPSISATSGFVLNVANVEGQKQSLFFYGVTGRSAAPWGASSSFLCVKAPTQRMPGQNTGGTTGACDGTATEDWLAYLASHPFAVGQPFMSGVVVDAQLWYRDPPSPKTTMLTGGLEFTTIP